MRGRINRSESNIPHKAMLSSITVFSEAWTGWHCHYRWELLVPTGCNARRKGGLGIVESFLWKQTPEFPGPGPPAHLGSGPTPLPAELRLSHCPISSHVCTGQRSTRRPAGPVFPTAATRPPGAGPLDGRAASRDTAPAREPQRACRVRTPCL